MDLKIHFRALTELSCSEDQSLYDLYVLIKSQTAFCAKPGFLTKAEIKTLSTKYYNGKTSTVYSRLNRLARYGYITKSKWGYTLTSTRYVLNNITNFTESINAKGHRYHPHRTVNVPNTSSTKIIELLRLYLLLKQIYHRKTTSNGLYLKKSRKRNYTFPERISVALEYLKKAGKYSSKMIVDNKLRELERVGLISITRGHYNPLIGSYDQNEYELYDIKKANWYRLNDTVVANDESPESYLKSLINNPVVKSKRKQVVKSAKPRVKTFRTELETRFINWVHVNMNKKIGKNSISKTLNTILAEDEIKKLFLQEFKVENVTITLKNRTAYDPKANSYHRNLSLYTVEIPSLVDDNGNYDGRTLTTYDEALKKRYAKRNDYILQSIMESIIDDITGEVMIEDNEDYYYVMNEAKIEKLGYDTYRLPSDII